MHWSVPHLHKVNIQILIQGKIKSNHFKEISEIEKRIIVQKDRFNV